MRTLNEEMKELSRSSAATYHQVDRLTLQADQRRNSLPSIAVPDPSAAADADPLSLDIYDYKPENLVT